MSEKNSSHAKSKKSSYYKPDHGNGSVEYWRKMFYSANSSRKEGWRRYYKADRKNWLMLKGMSSQIKSTDVQIPTHIKNEYIAHIASFDEEKRECPICCDPMNIDDSMLTDCGHMYHARCVDPHPNCPTCRRPIKSTSQRHQEQNSESY